MAVLDDGQEQQEAYLTVLRNTERKKTCWNQADIGDLTGWQVISEGEELWNEFTDAVGGTEENECPL